jgi:hypothetical protein
MADLSWSGKFQEPNQSMLSWLEQVRQANEQGLPIPPPPPDAGLGTSSFYMTPAPPSGAETVPTVIDPLTNQWGAAERLSNRNKRLAPLAGDQAKALKEK